jgi:hypothetical protein
MPLDDASQSPDDTAATARSRRRSSRPWSNPAPAEGPAAAPAAEDDWASRRRPAPPRSRPPVAPPILPAVAPPGAAEVDLAPVLEQLAALQAQVAELQEAVAASAPGVEAVSGAELAASIEALGNALGGGMATLLTEHRNLLARDIEQASDRILDEVGVRLRAASTTTVDGIEERVRALVARSLGELAEQVDLRLDKVQGDVAGLRAVMLDLPDQTAVTDRLDELAETLANAKPGRSDGRITPAMANAIEKAMAGPIEQIEGNVHTVVDVVRELLDERLPDGMPAAEGAPTLPDAAAIEALTAEMTALRRRISLRLGADEPESQPAADPEPDAEDAKPARAAKTAARARGRRSRQIED